MEDSNPESSSSSDTASQELSAQAPAMAESGTFPLPSSTTENSTSHPQNEEAAVDHDDNGTAADDGDNIVIVVFEEGESVDDNPNAMTEADLASIKNAIEEKRRERNQSLQETFDEGDSMSQPSSLPSTPASFADNFSNIAAIRKARGRRKRMGQHDVNVRKKFTFLRSITKRAGQRSLRRLLSRDNGDTDRLGEADHSYFSLRKSEDLGTVTDEKATNEANQVGHKGNGDYYRAIFFSQYDDQLPLAPTDDSVVSCDIDVDDSGPIKESATTNGGDVPPEEIEMDQALAKYFDAGLSAFNASYVDAHNLATLIGEILGHPGDDTASEWEDQLARLAESPSRKRLIERITKLLHDVQCSNLLAAGNSDEWLIRWHSVTKAASLMRQAFSTAVTSAGFPLVTWAHWHLLKVLPSDVGAWYLLILREIYHKAPDIIVTVINLDKEISQRAMDLLSGFLLEPKRFSLSGELFCSQQPPPRLPKDPILMLVSSTLKAHSDMIARGNSHCYSFYKNILPHLGFCMDVKFSPFKKGMTIGLCADQLCAFVKDKIREVQYFYTNRPIVLIGWQTSALVALKVALEKSVAAVVCLGFPNVTLYGPRGGVGDDLLDVSCPTLFVVGQFASTCSMEDLMELRRNMKSESTGLIVVGGADDDLKMSDTKLASENLCQEIVDRCVLESIGEFLCPALDAYIEAPDEMSIAANTTSAVANVEGDTASPHPAKRRRNTVGQIFASPFDMRKFGKIRMRSGGKSTPRASLDVTIEEKPTDTSASAIAEAASTKPEETNLNPATSSTVTAEGVPALGATRTRQIRKPHLLDL